MKLRIAIKTLFNTLQYDENELLRLARHAHAKERMRRILGTAAGSLGLLVYTIFRQLSSYDSIWFFIQLIFTIALAIWLAYIWKPYRRFLDRRDYVLPLSALMHAVDPEIRSMPLSGVLTGDIPAARDQLERLKRSDQLNRYLSAATALIIGLNTALAGGGLIFDWYTDLKEKAAEPSKVSSANALPVNAPDYEIADGEVTLNRCPIVDGSPVFPSRIEGLPVTKIGASAFAGMSDITHVEIPEGITEIGSGAFKKCINLKTITLPSSLTALGAEVFQNCQRLLSCSIPSGVTVLRASVFDGCSAIEHVDLPDTLTKIGAYAFRHCYHLKTVRMPAVMAKGKISESAFESCKQLEKITIPDGVIKISAHAFRGCSNLQQADIPGTLNFIGSSAFRECSRLRQISIPLLCVVNERAFKDSPTRIHRN